jgi:hypothetical protein
LEAVVVERGAVIGMNATLVHGSHIGEEAVVAAGSVVTGNVPPRSLAAGVPAKIKKPVEGDSLEWVRISAPTYRHLAQSFMFLNDRQMMLSSTNQPERLQAPEQRRGRAVIGGVTLEMSRTEVLARARQALQEGVTGADNYKEWYVKVDDRPVAPKWLVGLLSGLPVSQFDTSSALRVLQALGLDGERVRSPGNPA